MSSSEPRRRRAVLAVLGLGALAGCNLRPMLGGQGGRQTVAQLEAVDVDAPKSALGQDLQNAVLDELRPNGVGQPPRYMLYLRLERSRSALAVQLDETITRYDTTILVRYELRRKADAAVLMRGAARRVASYNVVSAPYATLVAQQDAEHRAALELAVEIRTRLAIHFGDQPA